MKQKILTAGLLLFSALAFSQTEATTKDGKKVILNSNGTWLYADCAALLKTENYSGQTMTSNKESIKISADGGKTGLKISLIKGSAIILNFGIIEAEVKCIRAEAPMVIEFTDGTKTTVNHMSKLSCEGNFSVYFSSALGNVKQLEMLKTKKIKKVTIEYTDTEKGVIVKQNDEFVFGTAQADAFVNVLQCLSNL
jgi:uncharacterized protein YkvS